MATEKYKKKCSIFCCFLSLCGFLMVIQSKVAIAEQQVKNATQLYQDAGLRIDFSVETALENNALKSDETASAIFRITDKNNQKPSKGLSPVAWMVRSNTDHPVTEAHQCEVKIQELHKGHLSHQPEVNLNSFLILTLNQDNTISVVNPQVAWSRTKLEAIVELPGRGDAWVLDKSRDHLYVVIPEQSSVVVIDTRNWHLINTIKLGENAKTSQILLQADGRLLWIALDKTNEAFAVDTASNQVAARIPVGKGEHSLGAATDNRFVYVSDDESKSLSVIDTHNLKKLSVITFDNQPSMVIPNDANGMIYVVATEANVIYVIDPNQNKITNNIPADKGITALRFSHDCRYGFALNRQHSTASLIDASQQKVIATSKVVDQPDQVVFSHHYAYVRGLGAPQFSVFDLFQVANGELAPANVEAGQLSATKDPAAISRLDMVAPTPDGHSAILANAPDRMLYYYMEGMMAASGSLDNGSHIARGVLILDRSLKEVAPGGLYSVTFNLPTSGEYDVPFVLDKPRIRHCFHVKVESAQEKTNHSKIKPQVSPVSSLLKTSRDGTVDVRFKITDQGSQKPIENLHDVQVLVVATSGNWQSKHYAVYEGDGIYLYRQRFKNQGNYIAMLGIPSLGIDYNRNHKININVTP